MTQTTRHVLKVIYTLIVSGLLLVWVMQNSVNAYWTQTYHRQSPLVALSRFDSWQRGGDLHHDLKQWIETPRWQFLSQVLTLETPQSIQSSQTNRQTFIAQPLENPQEKAVVMNENPSEKIQEKGQVVVAQPIEQQPIILESLLSDDTSTAQAQSVSTVSHSTKNFTLNSSPLWHQKRASTAWQPLLFEPKSSAIALAKQQKIRIPLLAQGSQPLIQKTTKQSHSAKEIAINKQQMVFFAGDSLMQGVAPHVKHALRKKYGIKSLDLSKQSTGLAYSSFFDWQKTIEKTLKKHKKIGLLVIFLGPNDPWDMPNPKGGKYLRFQSGEWENIYRKKIQNIIKTAKQHNVQVLWLGVPDMRKKKLNTGVRYLNTLYRSEVEKAKATYLPTQFLLTRKTAGYSKYLSTENNQKIAVRTNDGIHFTRAGQKRIANRILSTITIKE